MTRVELRNVTLRYPGSAEPALSNVSLSIEPGELLCLVGPSGCGKTTLLKVISGLIAPTSGAVTFDSLDMSGVPAERRRAAMVFQSHLLFPYMSVLDNVGFSLRMRGAPKDEWIPVAESMLERVKLAAFGSRRPATLSAGQRQRVALARALVAEPRVLLLDEPLSNLDRHLRDEMRQPILELQRETGVTTVCVTHDQEEAVLLGDRIAMVAEGEVRQTGVAEDFYERPVSMEVARFFGNHNQISGVRNGDHVETTSGRLVLPTEGHPSWPSAGTVCVHIRPEAIVVAPRDTGTPNCVAGTVRHRVYVGTHTRYVVDVEGQPWQAVVGVADRSYSEGDRVDLQLPAERLWLTEE
jgi:ABC-type Fe3+/spermidine/putrescine transport system ATPase subunit